MFNYTFLKQVVSKFTGKKPDFLVIEIINHYIQVTLLKADFSNKNILICKNITKDIKKLDVPYLLKEVKNILRKIPKKSDFNVILNLDSSLASTVYSSVSLIRSKPKELIDEADLDNLISQVIWKFFDKHRSKVSKKMGIEEIDVLLGDVRIRGIKVDGHKVVNPLGFKAKSVEIYLSETFTIRDFIKGIREIMPLNKIVFVSEAGTILSHTLFDSIEENNPLFLVNLFPNQTSIFKASVGHLHHIDNFNWGGNALVEKLRNNFKLDNAVAKTVIETYNRNDGSPRFIKKLENIFIEESRSLINGIESLASEEGAVFINPYFNFPSCLISDRFQSKFNKKFKLQLLSTDSIMKSFGFTVQFNKSVKKIRNLATLSSVLLELSLMPKNKKISYLANRRVRWLLS
ncbi:hypothetical protein KJ671_00715 [Patescibacteria group bacterium]|nr:hypothetical protein [Patescibacteria group bacterium]